MPDSGSQSEDFLGKRSLLRSRRSRVVLASVAGLIVLGAVAFFFLAPAKTAFAPMPKPNGYDLLLSASAKIVAPGKTVKEMATDELAASVAQNKAALDELRRGLDVPSAVPVQMRMDWIEAHLPELSAFRTAALALDIKASHLQQQGDSVAALDVCLDLLRLSEAIEKQGLLIDYLVAAACEAIATRRMSNLLSSLSAADCERATRELYVHDTRRASFEQIVAREAEWSRRTYGVLTQIPLMISKRSLRPSKYLTPGADKKYENRVREVRGLIIDIAARAFEMKHGRRPQSASELVPEFLPAVPLDPASRAPLTLQ